MDTFYLGVHEPGWLARLTVPLFVSRRRLMRRPMTFPRACASWALDSGGFSEISMYGQWRTTPATYVEEVRRFAGEIGQLTWAAIQDWMVEPFMLKKTGLTMLEHQRRTVESYAELLNRAPELPWTPVLQGWQPDDYMRHAGMYEAASLPLRDRVVGVGSVCRRQGTRASIALLRQLGTAGYRLHGFGLKSTAMRWAAAFLESADSMAWSFQARRWPPLAGCTHVNCANCSLFALEWRARVLGNAERGDAQLALRLP